MFNYKVDENYYTTTEEYVINTNILPEVALETDYLKLSTSGVLTISETYSWDGATCAIDTASFMRGSLVHDSIYQLIELGLLDSVWRKEADKLLVKICREDGMNYLRSKYVYAGVRLFGKVFLKSC